MAVGGGAQGAVGPQSGDDGQGNGTYFPNVPPSRPYAPGIQSSFGYSNPPAYPTLAGNMAPAPPAGPSAPPLVPQGPHVDSAADIAKWNAAAHPLQQQTPPAAPEFMTPAMQQYVNKFQASQASQQQAINAGIWQATAGLASRRDAAAKTAATLPAAYQKAYAAANATAQTQAKTVAGTNVGPVAQTAAGAASAGVNAARDASDMAAGTAGQGLINAGITADYSKGVTTLANQKMANQSALNDAQSAFDMQMLHDQSNFDSQRQSVADATTAATTAYDRGQANMRLQSSLTQPKGATAADLAAQKVGFPSDAAYSATLGSQDYQRALSTIKGGGSYGATSGDVNTVLRTLMEPGRANGQLIINALIAQQAISPKDVAAAQASLTNGRPY